MSKRRQLQLLRQCAALFAAKRTCNERSLTKWMKLSFYAHMNGMLYVGFNGPYIDMAVIAYRVSELPESLGDTLPEKEEGDILYVCAAASKTKDSRKLFRLMRWYLRENPDVIKLAYHVRNSDNIRVHQIRRVSRGQKV